MLDTVRVAEPRSATRTCRRRPRRWPPATRCGVAGVSLKGLPVTADAKAGAEHTIARQLLERSVPQTQPSRECAGKSLLPLLEGGERRRARLLHRAVSEAENRDEKIEARIRNAVSPLGHAELGRGR